MRSRLADDYPDQQTVLVDDRSTDGTGAIMDALAAADPRVRVLHVTALPAGWLGKVHALEQGRQAADGEWCCFSDADVCLQPGAMRAAVAHAEARGLDFLTVIPALWPSGFVVDATLSTFTRALAVGARLWAVRDPRSSAFAGIGAFILVRRASLDRTPGFEWLRLEVVDDGGLGLMCKRAGLACDVAAAPDLMGLHFYRSLREMARGVEKNGFAAAGRFSWPRMLALAALWPLLDCGVLAAAVPGLPAWLRVVGAAGGVAAVAATLVVARWCRRPVASALAVPLGTVVLVALLLRSAWRATRQGGIAWRGTLYPLADLRAGQRIFR